MNISYGGLGEKHGVERGIKEVHNVSHLHVWVVDFGEDYEDPTRLRE